MVESPGEGHNIGSNLQLVLLVPGAGEQLLRADGAEHRQVDQGQLAGKIVRGHGHRVKNGGSSVHHVAGQAGALAPQAGRLAAGPRDLVAAGDGGTVAAKLWHSVTSIGLRGSSLDVTSERNNNNKDLIIKKYRYSNSRKKLEINFTFRFDLTKRWCVCRSLDQCWHTSAGGWRPGWAGSCSRATQPCSVENAGCSLLALVG